MELAKNRGYVITKIFREVASGETLAARPQMQQLLAEVENGLWEGVLVMEVERLARGNSIDQGIVSQTFRLSDTLIITPAKIYNPSNDYDEEYFEFGLFMSRREYKTINRRLSAGRLASCKEGKYVGALAPYGYKKEKIEKQKGWVLVPDEKEAEIVKQIYSLYLSDEEKTGFQGIANRLKDSHVYTRKGNPWTAAQIKYILTNDVYIGKIHWQKMPEKKKPKNGQIVKMRYRSKDYPVFDGLHEAIIDADTFNKVKAIIDGRIKSPNNTMRSLQNPFAGILVCSVCGRPMKRRSADKRRPGHSASFDCITRNCPTVGSPVDVVEAKVISGIKQWYESYNLQNRGAEKPAPVYNDNEIKNCKSKLTILKNQLNTTFSLLEQGLYDKDTFIERRSFLKSEINSVQAVIAKLEKEDSLKRSQENYNKLLIPELENLLRIYDNLPNAKSKNDLIKKIFYQIRYTKTTKGNRWRPDKVDDFELEFISRLPLQ